MRRLASKMQKKLKKDFVFYKREVSKSIANPAGSDWIESFVMMSIEIEADGDKTSESEYETSSSEEEEEEESDDDEASGSDGSDDDVEAARSPRNTRSPSHQRSGSPRAQRKMTGVVPEEAS
jgi:hypothetical protein